MTKYEQAVKAKELVEYVEGKVKRAESSNKWTIYGNGCECQFYKPESSGPYLSIRIDSWDASKELGEFYNYDFNKLIALSIGRNFNKIMAIVLDDVKKQSRAASEAAKEEAASILQG